MSIRTETQVSAGGVAFRWRDDGPPDVALIRVAGPRGERWQLPKGLVDPDEPPELAAMREVREETGITTDLLAELETVEYWYVATRGAARVRYHKFVHFFLLLAVEGDVRDHDREVLEARWVEIEEAEGMLAFPGERRVVAQARAMLLHDGAAPAAGMHAR